MRFNLEQQEGGPLVWPLPDIELANVVVIDMERPLAPQALRAAIAPRSGMELGTRSTLLAAALTAVALGVAAISWLA
jgi:hypothetical protein